MNFLTAEWRKLAIINYEINPELLLPYLPAGTELDFYHGKCYISLVGFMFLNTKLLGFPIPFHRNFEEVNLRFYVKKKEGDQCKRGVVFVKEIVPKPALSLVANSVYQEHYETMPMQNTIHHTDNEVLIRYSWKDRTWHSITVTAGNNPLPMKPDSEFEFITEHYFGFTKKKDKTAEYEVCHPKWEYYEVKNHDVKVDFESLYGSGFRYLNLQRPISVMLAEGSKIRVKTKKYLQR